MRVHADLRKIAFVFGVASEIHRYHLPQLAGAGTLYLGYQKRFMSWIFKLKDQLLHRSFFNPREGRGCVN